MPTLASSSAARLRAAWRETRSWICTTSAICAPMVWMGEKELIGSWKIMPMRARRMDSIALPSRRRAAMSVSKPSLARSRMRPLAMNRVLESSCISASAVMLLPDPLSPTSASTSPRPIVNETSSVMRVRARSCPSAIDRSVTVRTGCAPVIISPRIGIGGIAQSIADEVEGQHSDDHECAGNHQPRCLVDRADALRREQQDAPAFHRLAQAETEEGQRGLRQQDLRKRDRGIDDQVAEERRQQMSPDDAVVGAARQPRRQHEVLVPGRQQLAAHGTREPD